ncbi:MAG: radical SAM protein [Anaerolineae bacterium]|nr:radical SAM protein [Anaerolineae bacterium]
MLNLAGNRLQTLPLVVLYLTDGCNSRCITCDIWRNPRRNMSLSLVEEITNTFADLEVRWVLLSGGEAMQHPDWPLIAQRCRQAGAHVMLLTNGLLLRRQADAVLENVDEVIVSLDAGTPATYEAIRGVDAFDLVLEGIRAVHAGGLPVTTRTTVQRANYREIPQIIEIASQAGADHISFLTVDVSSLEAFGPRFTADPSLMIMPQPNTNDPSTSALDASDIEQLAHILDEVEQRFADFFASGRIAESPAKLRRMLGYFRALLGEGDFSPPRCNAPHFSTVIEVDGTLRPCYFLPAYGKIEGAPLPAVLNGDIAQTLRQAYRSGQRPECARCVCPLYKGPRTLLRM